MADGNTSLCMGDGFVNPWSLRAHNTSSGICMSAHASIPTEQLGKDVTNDLYTNCQDQTQPKMCS